MSIVQNSKDVQVVFLNISMFSLGYSNSFNQKEHYNNFNEIVKSAAVRFQTKFGQLLPRENHQ